MTGHINWMAYTQEAKDGSFNTQGNAVADAVEVTSGNTSAAAPQGAQYAAVYVDVASTIEANIISTQNSPEGEAIFNAKELVVPAGVWEIPNVVPGITTITVTDL